MMLTVSMPTPFDLALERRFTPSWVRPSGMTGRVNETSRPGCSCWSSAIAFARRVFAAVSGSAPPSTSKSTLVSLYASTTLPYAAARASADEQFSASSEPAAPPKDTRTSPPLARRSPICAATALLPRSVTPPHLGVQPPPSVTKARL
jgi:hypothetical protein